MYPTTAYDAETEYNSVIRYESIKVFYCVFVRTEINLIAFSGPRNCVNTQYAALSGAMAKGCGSLGGETGVRMLVCTWGAAFEMDWWSIGVFQQIL